MRSPSPSIGLHAVFVVIAAGTALAQSPTPPPTPPGDFVSFAQLDRNQDGFVVKAEIPPGHPLLAKFAQYDADNDGKLSPAEFDKYTNDTR